MLKSLLKRESFACVVVLNMYMRIMKKKDGVVKTHSIAWHGLDTYYTKVKRQVTGSRMTILMLGALPFIKEFTLILPHIYHTWMHSELMNSFGCVKCNAEVTDYQLLAFPFLSFATMDSACDEIWTRLKLPNGYMCQRICTHNPEKVKPWLWDVRLVREEVKVDWY